MRNHFSCRAELPCVTLMLKKCLAAPTAEHTLKDRARKGLGAIAASGTQTAGLQVPRSKHSHCQGKEKEEPSQGRTSASFSGVSREGRRGRQLNCSSLSLDTLYSSLPWKDHNLNPFSICMLVTLVAT